MEECYRGVVTVTNTSKTKCPKKINILEQKVCTITGTLDEFADTITNAVHGKNVLSISHSMNSTHFSVIIVCVPEESTL